MTHRLPAPELMRGIVLKAIAPGSGYSVMGAIAELSKREPVRQ